jgi:hypothetical protein
MVSRHPPLTLAEAYAALSYHHAHREEVPREMQDDDDLADAMTREVPSNCPGASPATTPRAMRFHRYEHAPRAVADGLRSRGIDVTTTPRQGFCPPQTKSSSPRRPPRGESS